MNQIIESRHIILEMQTVFFFYLCILEIREVPAYSRIVVNLSWINWKWMHKWIKLDFFSHLKLTNFLAPHLKQLKVENTNSEFRKGHHTGPGAGLSRCRTPTSLPSSGATSVAFSLKFSFHSLQNGNYVPSLDKLQKIKGKREHKIRTISLVKAEVLVYLTKIFSEDICIFLNLRLFSFQWLCSRTGSLHTTEAIVYQIIKPGKYLNPRCDLFHS